MAKFSDIKARYEHDGELGADSIEWLIKHIIDLDDEAEDYFRRLNKQDLLDEQDVEYRKTMRLT